MTTTRSQPIDWTETPTAFRVNVGFSGRGFTEWAIHETAAGTFVTSVRVDHENTYTLRTSATLVAARRFASRFVDKANGWQLLEKELSK